MFRLANALAKFSALALCAAGVALGAATLAYAQTYPQRPVRVIVAFDE